MPLNLGQGGDNMMTVHTGSDRNAGYFCRNLEALVCSVCGEHHGTPSLSSVPGVSRSSWLVSAAPLPLMSLVD